MKTVCEKCNKEFNLSVRTEKLPGSVERIYFICPQCETEYTSHYLDDNIRAKQLRVKVMQDNYLSAAKKKESKKAIGIFRRMQDMKKEIGKDMDKLKEKMENVNV